MQEAHPLKQKAARFGDPSIIAAPVLHTIGDKFFENVKALARGYINGALLLDFCKKPWFDEGPPGLYGST